MGRRRREFWECVDKTTTADCWLWRAAKTRLGYGQFWNGQKITYAHRQSWLIAHGNIPDGMCILHKCDNPTCVNPSHLFMGTMRDNTRDMVVKQRCYRPAGELSKSRKLDWSKVDKIRDMWKQGESYKTIAVEFNIGRRNVCHIVKGERWKEHDRQCDSERKLREVLA